MKFKEFLDLTRYEKEPVDALTDDEIIEYFICDYISENLTPVSLIKIALQLKEMPQTQFGRRIKNMLSFNYDLFHLGNAVDPIVNTKIRYVEAYNDGWNIVTVTCTYYFNQYSILIDTMYNGDYDIIDN